jgi:hypothetical protein
MLCVPHTYCVPCPRTSFLNDLFSILSWGHCQVYDLCSCCSWPHSVLSVRLPGHWLECSEHSRNSLAALPLRWDLSVCDFPGKLSEMLCSWPAYRLTHRHKALVTQLLSGVRLCRPWVKAPFSFSSASPSFFISLLLTSVINRSKYTKEVYLN